VNNNQINCNNFKKFTWYNYRFEGRKGLTQAQEEKIEGLLNPIRLLQIYLGFALFLEGFSEMASARLRD